MSSYDAQKWKKYKLPKMYFFNMFNLDIHKSLNLTSSSGISNELTHKYKNYNILQDKWHESSKARVNWTAQ